MNRIFKIGIIIAAGIIVTSCKNPRRKTGRVYMPDMAYSRAYETYSSNENLKDKGINYSGLPVAGTIARGDSAPYTLPNSDTGYAQSKYVVNPIKQMTADEMKEAERLFLVNCAICHGAKLDGNGPLWNGGNGPFPAAPKNLMADDAKQLAAGTMFHATTFGKGQMGSYASQLNINQRWMVVSYVKTKQAGTGGSAKDTSSVGKTDTAAKK